MIQALSPIFLRRTKADVLSNQLPEKTEYTIPLMLDKHSERQYLSIIKSAQDGALNGMMLAAIQNLIMLCSHPALVVKGTGKVLSIKQLIEQSPKLKWTIEKLKCIQAKNEKVILFTKYKKMQSILRYVMLDQLNIDAQIINGDVTGNRLELIDQFSNNEGFGVIILSPKAAGVGLTITAANHVIHYTREWNPAIENQATDRVYRIGQNRPVSVYYPIMISKQFLSAEEKLSQLLGEKRQLMRRVVIPANLELQVEDFQEILSGKG